MGKRIREYTYEELKNKILVKARVIHKMNCEHIYSIEHDGTLFKYPSGDKNEVMIPPERAKSAVIVLHNHPNEFKEPSTFSGIDIFNLLYYRLNEIIVCSYGRYFQMSDNGCMLRSSEAMHLIDKEFKKIDGILYSKYIMSGPCSQQTIKENYRKYKIEVEREYKRFLKRFARENNLKYYEGEL